MSSISDSNHTESQYEFVRFGENKHKSHPVSSVLRVGSRQEATSHSRDIKHRILCQRILYIVNVFTGYLETEMTKSSIAITELEVLPETPAPREMSDMEVGLHLGNF